MPTQHNPANDPTRDDVDLDDDDEKATPAEPKGGFYADSPSDGPNRRGPDTGYEPQK
jgi:hypothetical protein